MENPHVLALCGPSVVGRIQCTWAQVRAHEDCGVKMAQFSAHWFSKGDRCGHSCGSRPAAIWRDKLIPCKLHGFARTNSGHPLWHHWCCSLLFTAVAVDVVELNVYQYVSWCNGLLVSSSYYDQNNFRQWQIYMLPLTVWERLTSVFCLIWMLSIIV